MAATFAQKLGALSYILFFSAGFWCWLLFFALLYFGGTVSRGILAVYCAYIWFGPGRLPPMTGSRKPFLRGLWVWRKCAEYCPMTLVKTAELDPEKTYVLGFHPHGIISMSAFITFATEALNVSKTFPGIRFHMLTLVQNFYIPFIRDFVLAHGMCDCARSTCLRLLKGRKGSAIVLCVGGAREALLAQPNHFEIVLGKRLGFVRIAVRTGSALVPVLSFGENNMFQVSRPLEDTFTAKLQRNLLKLVGLGFPIFHGTGIMLSSIGMLPYQGAIHVVVGAPIEVPKFEGDIKSGDGKRAVKEAHDRYVAALRGLWDAHKGRYAMERKGTLKIVDLPPQLLQH
ncbi:g9362 [Coccomyxa elongata]